MAEDEELPEELEDQCEDCHKALTEIERLLNPLLSTSKAQSEEKLTELDCASQTLLLTYSINSLFWVYLVMKGIDPKTHLVKQELERVQKVMKHAQAVSKSTGEGKGSTQIDSRAAKRFIRSALWEKDKDQGKEKRIKLESEPETS